MTEQSTSVNGAAPPPAAPQLPPLYQSLEPLNPQQHGQLRMRDAGFGFARGLSAIPIAVEEFVPAGRHLAIVFAAQAPHMPVVIAGLAADHNMLVDAGGRWRKDTYVPSYLRRFPFFLVRVSQESEDLALCLDPKAPQLSTTEGEALFDTAGQPTEMAKRAFDFTRAVEGAFQRTREMAEGLALMGLLQPAALQFERDGKPFRVDGFHAVQREALNKLSAEQLVMLRDKGWLDAIYAHLLSLGGIPELAQQPA
ncbi:MAG: SapC family protein [Acetobacteraceae bacterium]|nr:SapC family protein [Acetobacteraceae bacterium]